MSDSMSRRQAGRIMLSAAALASMPGAVLWAQPSKNPPQQPPASPTYGPDKKKKSAAGHIDLEKLIKKGRTHDWDLKVTVTVQAETEEYVPNQSPKIYDIEFDSAVVVFPVLSGTSSHKGYTDEVRSKLTFNDALVTDKAAEYSDKYPCGTRLGKWEMKKKTGREMQLEVTIPTTCWRTVFDEDAGEQVDWPATWPAIATSTFTDLQAVRGVSNAPLIDHMNPAVQDLVRKWCDNKDPKKVKPVVLAKYLASNVLEIIQPSGMGLNFADNGMLEGMEVKGSTATILDGRGADHDMACALCAVYRAAGLPARLVFGLDVKELKGDDDNFLIRRPTSVPPIRTWVEFCLYDETSQKEAWIPVDVVRQRKFSSRILNNPRGWRYFGTHDEFDGIVPFAHQFHPPTTVMAHGSVCFWGWLTVPEAQVATQYVRFQALTTPKTTELIRKRKLEEEGKK
jgi:hypothetical protein